MLKSGLIKENNKHNYLTINALYYYTTQIKVDFLIYTDKNKS